MQPRCICDVLELTCICIVTICQRLEPGQNLQNSVINGQFSYPLYLHLEKFWMGKKYILGIWNRYSGTAHK